MNVQKENRLGAHCMPSSVRPLVRWSVTLLLFGLLGATYGRVSGLVFSHFRTELHLHNLLRPLISIRWYVRPSIGLSVHQFVCP